MTAEAAEILQELKAHQERLASPWCGRRGAAAYCDCSTSLIDREAAAGRIPVHGGLGDPRFKKSDLDRWIQGRKVQGSKFQVQSLEEM